MNDCISLHHVGIIIYNHLNVCSVRVLDDLKMVRAFIYAILEVSKTKWNQGLW